MKDNRQCGYQKLDKLRSELISISILVQGYEITQPSFKGRAEEWFKTLSVPRDVTALLDITKVGINTENLCQRYSNTLSEIVLYARNYCQNIHGIEKEIDDFIEDQNIKDFLHGLEKKEYDKIKHRRLYLVYNKKCSSLVKTLNHIDCCLAEDR